MRLMTSIALVVALVVCFGCAKKESAPANQPESQADAQVDIEPIAEEDFESGEVGETMTVGEGEDADVPEGGE